jgi:hypothetical protein
LRILFKPVIDFPLENLILVENMRTRSSQLTRSGETLGEFLRNTGEIKNQCINDNLSLLICYIILNI